MSGRSHGRRLVIFDVDGTLVDSQHVIFAAMQHAFSALGHPCPPRETALGVVGLSLPEAMAVLAGDLPDGTGPALVEHYRARFVADRHAAPLEAPPLFPGARAALDRLADAPGTVLGIATGKARPGLDHLLEAHEIGHLFRTAQTADLHPSKPDPAMLRAALAETGCAPGAAVMIGDTEFDVAMGRAAGMATVAVAWGYHSRARLAAAGPDAIVEDFDALQAALHELETRAA